MTNYSKNEIWRIVLSIFTCVLVGVLSSFATRSSVNTWFLTLEKPFFNPPSWVFAPVWTMLYILMGYSYGLIWNSKTKNKVAQKNALMLFGIQLFLNALWSILFFGLQNPFLACIEIILLWLLIFETIKAFKTIDPKAAIYLYPYLAWVTFATILNASIWYLNV